MSDLLQRQRKYTLAVFFGCVGSVALFTGKLGGGEYITLAGIVLGLYGAANVMEKKAAREYQ